MVSTAHAASYWLQDQTDAGLHNACRDCTAGTAAFERSSYNGVQQALTSMTRQRDMDIVCTDDNLWSVDVRFKEKGVLHAKARGVLSVAPSDAVALVTDAGTRPIVR